MRLVHWIAILAIAGLIGGLGWRYYQLANAPREPLPTLTLQTIDGLPGWESLATGRPALLHVWGADCADCQGEHILLQALRDEGIPIYGISADELASRSRTYLEERGNPFAAVMRDVEGQSARALEVEQFPTTFILSADGEVLARMDGPMDVVVLRNRVYPILEREYRRAR